MTVTELLEELAHGVAAARVACPVIELPHVALLEAAGAVARAVLDHQLGARAPETVCQACLDLAVGAVRIGTEVPRG